MGKKKIEKIIIERIGPFVPRENTDVDVVVAASIETVYHIYIYAVLVARGCRGRIRRLSRTAALSSVQ